MNKNYLVLKLAEEATEVAQAAVKLALFGEKSGYYDNLKDLKTELDDLFTVVAILSEKHLGGELTVSYSPEKEAKLKKYEPYYNTQ